MIIPPEYITLWWWDGALFYQDASPDPDAVRFRYRLIHGGFQK